MLRFVIHEHHARNLHWDLRLEIGGVLKSWAVPKEPPQVAGIKRLAIQTEDHPLSYYAFEGVIQEGRYGAGAVKIWDSGEFVLEEDELGKIVVALKGKRLSGQYCLIKTRLGWLFFKKANKSAEIKRVSKKQAKPYK